ncbi:Fc.00g039830.m01.CDS01 [Cosmosporella sp. VM-42]
MSTSTGNPFPLASEKPYGDDSAPEVDSDAGASGDSSGNSVSISQGGMIAIIVVVVVVVLLGTSTAVLFYMAKKREWDIKDKIRRSARKVVTAFTPRRSEFPSSVKDSSHRARARLDDVPPTPRLRPEDLEKGLAQAKAKRKERKWGRK